MHTLSYFKAYVWIFNSNMIWYELCSKVLTCHILHTGNDPHGLVPVMSSPMWCGLMYDPVRLMYSASLTDGSDLWLLLLMTLTLFAFRCYRLRQQRQLCYDCLNLWATNCNKSSDVGLKFRSGYALRYYFNPHFFIIMT